MDGKRIVVVGLMTLALAASACSSTPTAAPGGSPAIQPSQAPPVASPSGLPAKGGGVTYTSIKATLATVNGEGGDEKDFADTLRTATAGSIDVNVGWNWRQPDFTAETEIIQDVAAGKAQLGMVGLRAFDTVGVTSFMGLQAPFAIDSFDLEAKVLATDWAQKLVDGTRAAGVVGLGYVQGPLRQPLGITRSLTSAASFQGATFGIRPSKLSEMTLKALGATPKAWSALTGLDGIEMDTPSIAGNHYDVSAKALTRNVVLWPRPSLFFANAGWFDGLSADDQAVIRQAVGAVDLRTVDRVKTDAATAASTLCNRSVKVAEASPQAIDDLRAKVQPVIDELEQDPGTKATIEAIARLRGSAAGDAFAPCPEAAASAPPPAGATALDGTWATSFSKADLASSPFVESGEVNDGNWGDWTMTFGNGRVSYTQRNAVEDSDSSGTFAVKGDTVTMVFDQGANVGETFAFHWSVYRNTLTFLRDDALGVGPTPFMVKVWTKG